MTLIKILSKKHVRDILEYIKDNEEVQFGQIHKDLNLHKGSLGRLLNELCDAKLVKKRREESEKLLPNTYYRLTDKGKTALAFYAILDKLNENDKKKIVDVTISKLVPTEDGKGCMPDLPDDFIKKHAGKKMMVYIIPD